MERITASPSYIYTFYMESKVIVKIESKPINNPLYGKLSNTVCITEICEMEKFEVEMPDFSSVELTFDVYEDKTYSLKVYLNLGDFEDDKDDYVVPGDLNVVFS